MPVPVAGRLPGFNGAIGSFTRDLPKLSATSLVAGNPLKLSVTFHGDANNPHVGMPDPPATPAWEAFASGSPQIAGNSVTFTYTLIPQTDKTSATPEIPFSYFDPEFGKYVDLSIPAMRVTVLPGPSSNTTNGFGSLAADLAPEKKLSLSPLAPIMGRTAGTLVPLQERGWFFLVELGPVLLLIGAWLVSRRRLFWEQHPDLRRRRDARRALVQERRTLRRAAQSGDARAFASSGIKAIQVACAPHFPAEPRALVCRDILEVLPEIERTGENGAIVREMFGALDVLDYAGTPENVDRLLGLEPQLDRLLMELEARL
jgi:hypothetical protein